MNLTDFLMGDALTKGLFFCQGREKKTVIDTWETKQLKKISNY